MKNINIENDIIAHASILIQAPLEKVWRALMDPEATKAYMFGAEVISGWGQGDSISWKGEWQGKKFEDKGKVLRVEPEQLLQYTHYSPVSGKEDIPANYHTVTITLTEEDEGVFVALTQDKNDSPEARDHSEKNWAMMLEALKKYLERK
jgi:uncharacterized protein YndB with AHSA1/START domain